MAKDQEIVTNAHDRYETDVNNNRAVGYRESITCTHIHRGQKQ